MITEQHYTRQNEHPEDRIYKDKEYINRLQKHIDSIYEELARDLRLTDEGKEHLFDFVYNEDRKELEFEDYLNRFGYRYDEIALTRPPKSKYINL